MFARALILGLTTSMLFPAAAGREVGEQMVIWRPTPIPYSGPLSAYGTRAGRRSAYYKMIRTIRGCERPKDQADSLDDGYSPPKTVEQHRRLVESDEVLGIVGTMGTPGRTRQSSNT